MRTTVDLSNNLYRRVRAEAALRGLRFSDLVEAALHAFLASSEPEKAGKPGLRPSFHDLMQDCCGIVTDAPQDYATNSKYMEGFAQ